MKFLKTIISILSSITILGTVFSTYAYGEPYEVKTEIINAFKKGTPIRIFYAVSAPTYHILNDLFLPPKDLKFFSYSEYRDHLTEKYRALSTVTYNIEKLGSCLNYIITETFADPLENALGLYTSRVLSDLEEKISFELIQKILSNIQYKA